MDPIAFAQLPALYAHLAGGIFCGLTTLASGEHRAVVLLSAKPDQGMSLASAKAWAEAHGGELPPGRVAVQLPREMLDPTWHWTADDAGEDLGRFFSGDEGNLHVIRPAKLLTARAVVLVPVI